MRSFKFLVPLLTTLAVGCINLPEIDPTQTDAGTTSPETPPDAGSQDTLSLHLVMPGEPTFTNGSVDLRIELSGAAPEKMELLLDGISVATVGPPYTLHWDTAAVPEGSHSLTARATRGGSTYVSETHGVVVDRTSPTFVVRVPAPLSENILASEAMMIQATFSEPLKPDTLSAASAKLASQAGDVAAVLTLSSDGKTLNITPAAPIKAGTRLTASITSAVTDMAGNGIVIPADAWTWNVPLFVPLGSPLSADPKRTPNAYYPSFQLDNQERPVVAWVESDGTVNNVYVRRWNGTGWDSLGGPLNAYPGTTPVNNAALQLDAQGRPIVVWSQYDGTSDRVYVQRWTGSTWEPLGGALSNSSNKVGIDQVGIQASAAGYIFIVWREGGSPQKAYIRRWNGSSWESLGGGLASSSTASVLNFALQLDSKGSPVLAWVDSEYNGNGPTIHIRRWVGSTWESYGLDPSVQGTLAPLLQLDKTDQPVLAWASTNGSSRSVYVQRWNGSAWLQLGDALSATPGDTDAYPNSLAMAGDGTLFLTWHEPDATGAVRLYLRRWNGTTWEAVCDAFSANASATSSDSSVLRLDADGFPLMSWREINAGSSIYVYRYNR